MAIEKSLPSIKHLSDKDYATSLLEMASEMAWAVSLDGCQIRYCNRSASQMLHLDCQEQQEGWFRIVHPDDQDELHHNLAAIIETRSFVQDFRILRDDADGAWIKGRFELVSDASGNPQFIGVTARDLTRRLDAERQLEESQAIYRTLVESLPINVFRKDLEGKIVFANQRYCEELRMSLSQLIGKTDFDLFPDMANKYRKDDAWVLETGLPFHDIESHPRRAEDIRYVEVLKAPVTDATGRKIGIQGMFWDVTTRKKAEQALMVAKEAAEAHSRSKSDFLANISHEIRTPLNGIIGITDLLLASAKEKEPREYLELIQNSSNSLLTLINEILDFSKIESGKVQLQSKRFHLRDSLGDTIRSLAVRAHAKDLELSLFFGAEVPDQIVGDLDRLRQVLVNLVGNAIKFTHSGEVELRVELIRVHEERATLQFSVRDTGIGIPADKLDTIFIEFEQVDTSATRKYGGTGLGLSIAARLVALMGGKLRVESELDAGSQFTFEAAFHFQPSPPDPLMELIAEQQVILVVPNLTHRKSLENILMQAHVRFKSTHCLDHASRMLQDNLHFDAIVCDADLDQPELLNFILQTRRVNGCAPLPFLILTRVIASPVIEDLTHNHLIEAMLIKPVKEHEFLTALGWATGRIHKGNEVETTMVTAFAEPSRPLQVLLVEDNLVNQKLATGLLVKGGHKVAIAENGRVAIELYQKQGFDLVLLDIQMPEMDGYEACKRIRLIQADSGVTIPIIALTAHASEEDRVRCLEAGMDEYLAKPIRPERLFAMIEKLTGHSSKSISPEKPKKEKAHFIDWQHAFDTVGGDRALLVELIQVFSKDQLRLISAIETALEKADGKELRISAHALKGALNHLGGREPARLASQLESMAKNEELQAAPGILKELKASLEDVVDEMNRFLESS
jgi:two-component system, sensor histidine kinase and response regulator